MPKRSIENEDFFDILSLDNEKYAVKRSIFKEYPDLVESDLERSLFTIPYSNEFGTDLGNCFLEVELEVLKGNGQRLTKDDRDKVQPPNDFFDALFSDVVVLINGVEVGNIGTFHPQTALLHNLIDCDENFQQSMLQDSNIWLKDYQYPASNPVIRHRYIEESKRVKLFGRLNHNIFTTNRLLLPNVPVQIKLRRTDDRFCLIRSEGIEDKYKIVFHSCKLNVRRVLFYDSILEQLKRHAKNHVAKFPYTQTTMNIFQIQQGSSFNRSTPTTQNSTTLPKRAYFTICEPESINGNSWANNTMIFPVSHYGVNYVQFLASIMFKTRGLGLQKAAEEACVALDDPSVAHKNRAAYVSVGGKSFCWRSTGVGDFSEASSGNQCKEFPDGQLIDLSTDEAQKKFNDLISKHGARSGWFFWIKGTGNGCTGFKFGTGVTQAACSQQMTFYCQYPGSDQPTGEDGNAGVGTGTDGNEGVLEKAVEQTCNALDSPAGGHANRAEYVSVGSNSFCWRSTGVGEFC